MTKKAIRPIRIEGNIAYVALSRGYEAIIDAQDVPIVQNVHWYASVRLRPDKSIMTVYGASNVHVDKVKVGTNFIHRVIMGVDSGTYVDHIDGDGLNNRRCNLRLADKSQNGMNARVRIDSRSGVRGVSFWAARNVWRARIRTGGKCKTIGYFPTAKEAADAYAKASEELHGEYGRTG